MLESNQDKKERRKLVEEKGKLYDAWNYCDSVIRKHRNNLETLEVIQATLQKRIDNIDAINMK